MVSGVVTPTTGDVVPGAVQSRSEQTPSGDVARPERPVVKAPAKSWLVWGAGAAVYVMAVFHRSSLGVAGPMAAQRLGLNASQLAAFVMLQLAVYAAMQIPTGILVDRHGPRRMLLAAVTLMGTAQLIFAFVHGFVPALLARGLLGCGDAMTYVSVLRLAAGWFPARKYPVITSFTAVMGSAGNLAATLPLTGLLHGIGWTPTFAIAGGITLAYGVLLLRPATVAPFREAGERGATSSVGGRSVLKEVRSAWRLPAGRLGFWVHFTCMAGPTTFGVLWGFPYLTQGLGYPPSLASSLMFLLVLGGLVASLSIGQVMARVPFARIPMTIAIVVGCLAAWTTLAVWPAGRPPFAVVVAVICVLSVGGPASSAAFMLARDYNPRHRISTATGMVNVGGFVGTVLCAFLIGQVLDRLGGHGYSLSAFRWAWTAVIAVTLFGLFRLLTWWLRTRARVLMAEARGESVPVHLRPHRWDVVSVEELESVAESSSDDDTADPAPRATGDSVAAAVETR